VSRAGLRGVGRARHGLLLGRKWLEIVGRHSSFSPVIDTK
jgi:hypothetical protein